MTNYIDLGTAKGNETEYYVLLDIEECLIERLIDEYAVPARVLQTMSRPGEQYRLVTVIVVKAYEDYFLKAVEELEERLLACGYKDYPEKCGELIGELKELIRKEAADTGYIDLPTGGRIKYHESV